MISNNNNLKKIHFIIPVPLDCKLSIKLLKPIHTYAASYKSNSNVTILLQKNHPQYEIKKKQGKKDYRLSLDYIRGDFAESMQRIIKNNKDCFFVLLDPEYFHSDITFDTLLAQRFSDDVAVIETVVTSRFRTRKPLVMGLSAKILEHLWKINVHDEKVLLWSIARNAKEHGYKIKYYTIKSTYNFSTTPVINIITTFAIAAFNKCKLYQIPPIKRSSMKGAGVFHKKKSYITHTTLSHHESALFTLSVLHKCIVFGLLALFISGLIIHWHLTLMLFFSLIVFLYIFDLVFQSIVTIRSFFSKPEIIVTKEELEQIQESDLPTFTVLCPLYKEETILPQFVKAISDLDYPKEKLQVFLLLEEDDTNTIAAAKTFDYPYIVTLVVPHSLPKTKPKALNWGLANATGELIVIYDAEDKPEEDQLKKAVITFNKVDKNVFCIQAKLNFYNPKQNLLTRLFTAEYSTWFDLILPGLYAMGAPIPLGGTSNFFRKKDMVRVKGWDAFNVCEDCDLGMRLFKKGYKTAIFNSTTYEEANSNVPSWIRQRSHWIKGYIQGFFVHMRNPKGFMREFYGLHFLSFLIFVGGKTLSLFINPFLWFMTISYFLFRPLLGETIESFYPAPMFYVGLFTLIFGNALCLYNYTLGCANRNYWYLTKYSFIIPFYWLFMSYGAWRALYQIVVKPHYWEKTTHGLHLPKVEVEI